MIIWLTTLIGFHVSLYIIAVIKFFPMLVNGLKVKEQKRKNEENRKYDFKNQNLGYIKISEL